MKLSAIIKDKKTAAFNSSLMDSSKNTGMKGQNNMYNPSKISMIRFI